MCTWRCYDVSIFPVCQIIFKYIHFLSTSLQANEAMTMQEYSCETLLIVLKRHSNIYMEIRTF